MSVNEPSNKLTRANSGEVFRFCRGAFLMHRLGPVVAQFGR
jgi:hypothetical protein